MRGQEERKRERHARDGVWRPAGGEHPVARGFPGSRHPAQVRGQGGRALCPLAAPAKLQVGKSPKPAKGGTAQAAFIPPIVTVPLPWGGVANPPPSRPGRAEGGTAHAASITPIVMESSPSHDGAIPRRDVYDPRPLNPSLVSNRTAL